MYQRVQKKVMKHRLGVHIRMQESLHDVIKRADFLNLPFFQCFFVVQESGKLVTVTKDDAQQFLAVNRSRFNDLFCHISYWVNLASLGNNGYTQLKREIALAQRFGFNNFVLHPGTAKGALDKKQGIDALAIALNNLFKREHDITILLENTCHTNLAIGSDIRDFKQLLEKIDKPERIGFCIDTAHAYSFGHDIANISEQDAFISFLDATIGIDRIKLIHLNDTAERLGSYIDRHGIIGQGRIGIDALKALVMHPQLQHVPLILELPDISAEEELVIVDTVRKW